MQFILSRDYHNHTPLIYVNLRASGRAEEFSEAYFKGLYRRKLRQHLQCMWRYSTEAFEREWPREFARQAGEFESPEAHEAARREYLLRRAEALDDIQPEPWNEAAERDDFDQEYRLGIKRFSDHLPPDILNRVADIRVLALGVAATDVKRDIVKLCRENLRRDMALDEALRRHNRHMADRHPGSFIERLRLHDAKITGVDRRGRDLILRMDDEHCATNVSCVTCKDCEILRLQEDLVGAEWLYDEVHEDGGDFILHVLTFRWERDGEEKYDELTLRVRDVEIE